MSLHAYHREVCRLWCEAMKARVRPGKEVGKCWLRRKDVDGDFREGLTPAQCCLNWIAGRKVCGDCGIGHGIGAIVSAPMWEIKVPLGV